MAIAPTELSFELPRRAWYAPALGEADRTVVQIGRYSEDGCRWEFAVQAHPSLGLTLRLFADAWVAFTECPELFTALAELDAEVTAEEVAERLLALGLTDATPYERG